jgi:uncharacterized Zn-finger protein
LQQICLAENIKNLSIQSDNYLNSILGTQENSSKHVKSEAIEKQKLVIQYKEVTAPNLSIKEDFNEFSLDDDFQDSSSLQNEVFESNPAGSSSQKTQMKKDIPGLFQDMDGFDVIDDDFEVPVRPRLPRQPAPKYKVERVFPCSFCGRSFKTEGMVSRHELAHTGIKNFSCDICGMRFLYKSYVQNHLKVVHLKVKNFKCEICGFLMYSRTHYREHKKTHDPNAPKEEECGVCFKRFLRKHSLQVHMRVHVSFKLLRIQDQF